MFLIETTYFIPQHIFGKFSVTLAEQGIIVD